MAKRKMIQANLVKNSMAAYYAAIEIHNKPNISYRYETATLLMINAWELVLKAFIRKYIKKKSIFKKDKTTISFEKALAYTEEYINGEKPKSFTAIKDNLVLINGYRNNIIHFYSEALEPQIFMLLAKCALNYVEFLKKYFHKDVLNQDGLFILPLGFKLPFKPEDFLSKKSAQYMSSPESKKFIEQVVQVISDLDEQGIQESVVLGFNIYLENVSNISNSDLLFAITSKDEADGTIYKKKLVQTTSNPDAPEVKLTDNEIFNTFPLHYKDICDECKKAIPDFKRNSKFHSIMKEIKTDSHMAYNRKLDPGNSKTSGMYIYSELALDEIKKKYCSE